MWYIGLHWRVDRLRRSTAACGRRWASSGGSRPPIDPRGTTDVRDIPEARRTNRRHSGSAIASDRGCPPCSSAVRRTRWRSFTARADHDHSRAAQRRASSLSRQPQCAGGRSAARSQRLLEPPGGKATRWSSRRRSWSNRWISAIRTATVRRWWSDTSSPRAPAANGCSSST